MRKIAGISLVFLFIAGFFAASVFRFEHFILEGNHSRTILGPLVLLSLFSGIALFAGLKALHLIQQQLWTIAMYGAVTGLLVFNLLFGVEDVLSARGLYHHPVSAQFNSLRGHCGVYSGRALIQFYLKSLNPSVKNSISDFEISTRCLISHYQEVEKLRALDCDPSETPAQCHFRWMKVFAEKGYWSEGVRRLFLEQMKNLSKDNLITDESLVEYVVQDQDLLSANPPLLKQVGLEDDLTDLSIFLRQSEEYDNLVISKSIADDVSHLLHDQPPESFKALSANIKIQAEKLPDLEKDLAELRSRIRL